jgi:hypothetical protein
MATFTNHLKLVDFSHFSENQLNLLIQSSVYQKSQKSYLYLESHARYNKAYFEKDNSLSFAIFNGIDVIAVVFANQTIGEQLSYFTAPVGVFVSDTAEGELKYLTEQLITQKIIQLGRVLKLKKLILPDQVSVTGNFLNLQPKVVNHYIAFMDLSLSEDHLKQRTRKSARSLLNWGKNNLQIQIMNRSNSDVKYFKAFQNFHLEVAGRKTRSDQSWDLQYENLVQGEAFLILAYLGGAIVSGSYITCATEEAYYSVGVYNRELMAEKKPVARWPIFAAALEAKRIGLKTLILGDVGPHFANDKEKDIADFKKSFTDMVRIQTNLEIDLGSA